MDGVFEQTFPATLDGLAAGTEFLDGICPNPRLSIVFDEIASNIVRCSGAGAFTVRVIKGAELVLEVIDDGREFDPTRVVDPDINAPVEDRAVGGLGIFMVRKMSKSFTYAREGGRNRVKVVMA